MFYGILLSPDVIGVNYLDVVALKVTLLYNRTPIDTLELPAIQAFSLLVINPCGIQVLVVPCRGNSWIWAV